jgi:hypothetical protein
VSDWTLASLFGVDPGRAEVRAGSIPDVPARSRLLSDGGGVIELPDEGGARRVRVGLYPDGLGSVRFRDIATLEIEVEETLSGFPWPEGRRKIDQDDFAAIIESLRRENEAEFGPKADRPERLP